jgi:hypothetical protein
VLPAPDPDIAEFVDAFASDAKVAAVSPLAGQAEHGAIRVDSLHFWSTACYGRWKTQHTVAAPDFGVLRRQVALHIVGTPAALRAGAEQLLHLQPRRCDLQTKCAPMASTGVAGIH